MVFAPHGRVPNMEITPDMTRTILFRPILAPTKAVYQAVLTLKTRQQHFWYLNSLEGIYLEVGKLMTSALLDLGLLDKADVQNQTRNPCL